MAIVRCPNGHYYDNKEGNSCPYCSGKMEMGKTIPLLNVTPTAGSVAGTPNAAFNKTEMLADKPGVQPAGAGVIPPTAVAKNTEFGSTVILDEQKNSDVAPVRGWLVVIEGAKIGKDFRIRAGQNFLGRSKNNDICVDFDQTISKEKACVILYDEKANEFDVIRGDGSNLVYLNGERLRDPENLKDNDIIEIGETKFVFRSFCNEGFNY